jgi:hypothetical protein
VRLIVKLAPLPSTLKPLSPAYCLENLEVNTSTCVWSLMNLGGFIFFPSKGRCVLQVNLDWQKSANNTATRLRLHEPAMRM